MSRDSSRDERDQPREQESLGRMVLSQGRYGGATSSSSDEVGQSTKPPHDRAEDDVVQPEREQVNHGPHGREARARDPILARGRVYHVSPAERAVICDIGKFRTVALSDL